MSDEVESLPFDQYQRYRLVSDLLEQVRVDGEPLHVLDVGGRTALLRRFLPEDRIQLVDVEESDEEGLVLGTGSKLPFQDKSFDVVAAFDTLEHVPPPEREAFIAECRRVARRYTVIAGPFDAPRVAEAEVLLQKFLKERLEFEHRYLEEHRHYGLPDRAQVEAQLGGLGGEVESFGHGNLDRWLVLMCASMYMDHHAVLRGVAKDFHRFYNRSLYASDHTEPVYRHVVVAAYDGAPLPSTEAILGPPQAPAGTVAGFQKMAEELLTFDLSKDVFEKERERLLEVNRTLETDLRGHRESLAELRARRAEQDEVIAVLQTDLAGHKESLLAAMQELDDVRTAAETTAAEGAAVRRELQGDLEQHRVALKTIQEDLEGHKQVIEEVRSDAASVRALLGEREVELEQARSDAEALREELTSDLAQHKEALAAAETEIDSQRATVTKLVHDLSELSAARDADHKAFESVRAEIEGLLKEARTVLAERDVELAEMRAELERAQAAYAQFQREHDAVRTALEEDLTTHRQVLAGMERELSAVREARANEAAQAEAVLAEHRKVIEELEEQLRQHNEVKAEHERLLDERAAVINEMGSELGDRWRNLRRAVRWKIPEYPSA